MERVAKVAQFARAKSGHAQQASLSLPSLRVRYTSSIVAACYPDAKPYASNQPTFAVNLIYLLILQCGLFSFSQPSPHEARSSVSAALPIPQVFRRSASQQATVEYTLITLNSPDCGLYPVDKFPVRVQYRDTSPGLGKWISLDSMIATSKQQKLCQMITMILSSLAKVVTD